MASVRHLQLFLVLSSSVLAHLLVTAWPARDQRFASHLVTAGGQEDDADEALRRRLPPALILNSNGGEKLYIPLPCNSKVCR